MQQFIFKTLRKMPKLISLFIIIISFSSCKEFFEDDLANKNITVIAPSDNAVSINLNITFDWEDLEGASNYRIVLGSPNLNNPSSLYIDSTLTISMLQLSLNPGSYEWKLRGENNSSHTNYSAVMKLRIDSSYDLNAQSIILYAPQNNYYTNNNNFNYTWQSLYSANSYQLVVKTGIDWNTGSIILDTNGITTNSINSLTLSEGNYIWSVKGINTLPSQTNFATPWIVNIDLTPPNSSNLNLPNATTSNLKSDSLYLFDWSRAANIGSIQSPLFDSIYIYTDTIQSPLYRYGSLQEDTILTLPSSSGNYYWNIITFDKAGNQSMAPFFKKFIVL